MQSERFSHENLQLQSEFQRQLTRVNEIDALRQEMGELEEEIRQGESEMETIGGRTRNQEKLVDQVNNRRQKYWTFSDFRNGPIGKEAVR